MIVMRRTEFGRRVGVAAMAACLTLPAVGEAQVFTKPARPLERPKVAEKSATAEPPRSGAKACTYSVSADGMFTAYDVGPDAISRQSVSNQIKNINLKQGLWKIKAISGPGKICTEYERIDPTNVEPFVAKTLGLSWDCLVTCGANIPAPYVVKRFNLDNRNIDVRLQSSGTAYRAGFLGFDSFFVIHHGSGVEMEVSGKWMSK